LYAGLREIREPASWILAIIAMTVSVGKIWSITTPEFYTSPYFIGILIGFVAHELAHRGVARKYGLYAEFIASPGGLLITFATGFIPGLVILAPGYVAVYAPGPYTVKGAVRSVEASRSQHNNRVRRPGGKPLHDRLLVSLPRNNRVD